MGCSPVMMSHSATAMMSSQEMAQPSPHSVSPHWIHGRQRPATYQAHLAAQHVDQLRQLIQAVTAKQAAHRGHLRALDIQWSET